MSAADALVDDLSFKKLCMTSGIYGFAGMWVTISVFVLLDHCMDFAMPDLILACGGGFQPSFPSFTRTLDETESFIYSNIHVKPFQGGLNKKQCKMTEMNHDSCQHILATTHAFMTTIVSPSSNQSDFPFPIKSWTYLSYSCITSLETSVRLLWWDLPLLNLFRFSKSELMHASRSSSCRNPYIHI